MATVGVKGLNNRLYQPDGDNAPLVKIDSCIITNSVNATAAPSGECKLSVDVGNRQTDEQADNVIEYFTATAPVFHCSSSRIITNITKKLSIIAGEMYSTTCVQ